VQVQNAVVSRRALVSAPESAARMMARMMRYFLAQEGGELVILTATSGDTGSAVAHAFHNVDRISMVVLFPIKEVSDRQRKQMTTLGGNVAVIGVDGQFDDCQALVKRAFADPELKSIRFSSANSINIGRLLPQAVYYCTRGPSCSRIARRQSSRSHQATSATSAAA
jgi:threonine synthase